MVMAIALVVIVVGSVLFQLLSPWWTTPIASNWKQMDHTLTITVVITGLFFVAINRTVSIFNDADIVAEFVRPASCGIDTHIRLASHKHEFINSHIFQSFL